MTHPSRASESYPLVLWLLLVPVAACSDDTTERAPETPSLEAPVGTTAPTPTSDAVSFSVNSAGSQVDFLMEAPIENIRGKAPESVTGSLQFDLMDLTHSTGLIKIDLDTLTVYQTTREKPEEEFGEETKNDVQNEHMKNWLQISEDAPAEMHEANRYVEFRLNRLSNPTEANIRSMAGARRTVTAEVHGEFRLHGRTAAKSARVELTFVFDGDNVKSVEIKALDPVPVSLAEHEVQPRETFEKLAQKSLSALGQKVSDTAPVRFQFTADAQPAAAAPN